MLVSALDNIAWALNLRGTDVHCNPVFVAYLLISSTKATLYIHAEKLNDKICDYLKGQGVDTAPYEEVGKGLADYPDYNILIDPDETSYTLAHRIRTQEMIRQASPIPALQAVKNEAEIKGYHAAMIRDGIALVKFLHWLKPAVEAGGQTEMSIDRKLTELRSQQPLFRDISFDTPAAPRQRSAIPGWYDRHHPYYRSRTNDR